MQGPMRASGRALALLAAAVAAVALAIVLTTSPGVRGLVSAVTARLGAAPVSEVRAEVGSSERLAGLERLGHVHASDGVGERLQVGDVAEAQAHVPFRVLQPDPATLPAGAGAPMVEVLPPGELRLTFDEAVAARAFADAGQPDRRLPPGFDGSVLVLRVPAAVVSVWPGIPLAVGQTGALAAEVEGDVPVEQVLALLVELPLLPAPTREQLAAIGDWRRALPLPVPPGRATATATTLGGGPALELTGASWLGRALLWPAGGEIRAVGGQLPLPALRAVAEGLRSGSAR